MTAIKINAIKKPTQELAVLMGAEVGVGAMNSTCALADQLKMNETRSLMSDSPRGPPFAWLQAGIGEPSTPLAIVFFTRRSGRMEGQLLSRVAPMRPSPLGPWQTAQF